MANNFWKPIANGLDNAGGVIKNSIIQNIDDAGKITKLECNKPINDIYEFFMGSGSTGIRGAINNLAEGQDFTKAVKNAYTTAEGGLDYKAIAGTYIGGSLIGRVATGGGVYRDSTGNVNAPGIPFI